jgi:PAS domain-containing protein
VTAPRYPAPRPRLAVPADVPAGVDLAALVAALWDSPGVGVAIWDGDGRFVAVNDHVAAANQVPAAEHAGARLEDVLLPPARDVMRGLLDEVAASGTPRVGVELVAGDRVWETAWLPLCRDGQVVQVACLSFDLAGGRLPALVPDVPGAR